MVMEPEPVVVLVAARDARSREDLEARARMVDGCVVVGAIGRHEAILRVMAAYERPTGCPDVVMIDEGLSEAWLLDEELARACPGVRRIVAAPGDETVAGLLADLAGAIEDCQVA